MCNRLEWNKQREHEPVYDEDEKDNENRDRNRLLALDAVAPIALDGRRTGLSQEGNPDILVSCVADGGHLGDPFGNVLGGTRNTRKKPKEPCQVRSRGNGMAGRWC